MNKLDRITVCFEKGILPKLDRLLKERSYKSRSQAVSDFVRRAIIKRDWASDRECLGIVTVFYAAGAGGIAAQTEKLVSANSSSVLSIQNIPVGGDILSLISLKGRPSVIEKLADAFRGIKGIKSGSFSISAAL